jgi:hypothetical protein
MSKRGFSNASPTAYGKAGMVVIKLAEVMIPLLNPSIIPLLMPLVSPKSSALTTSFFIESVL